MTLNEVASVIDLDLKRTFSLFMGKEEMYVRYLKKFPENAERIMSGLETAVQSNDYKGIEAGAHGIKGVSANLGIQKVTEISTALMMDIRESTYEKIGQDYQQLKEQVALAIEYIGKLD